MCKLIVDVGLNYCCVAAMLGAICVQAGGLGLIWNIYYVSVCLYALNLRFAKSGIKWPAGVLVP